MEEPLTPAAMHGHAAIGNLGDDLAQALTHRMRRTGTRFLYIDCPSFVEAVRKVDLDSSEFCCLALGHHSEPVAPSHQPPVPINVGSLIGDEIAAVLIVIEF